MLVSPPTGLDFATVSLLRDALGLGAICQPYPHLAVFRLDIRFCKHVLQLGHTVFFVVFLRPMLLADDYDLAVLVHMVSVQLWRMGWGSMYGVMRVSTLS